VNLDIQEHAEGIVIALRAQPGAKRNAVVGEVGGALKVSVTAPPEDGRANDAILELLHEWLGIRRSQLELVAGRTNRNKRVLIGGVSVDSIRMQIEERLR